MAWRTAGRLGAGGSFFDGLQELQSIDRYERGHPLVKRECFGRYSKKFKDNKPAERTQILSIKTTVALSVVVPGVCIYYF
jgi:hypothetical protein